MGTAGTGGMPAPLRMLPALTPRSLKRSGEDKEQRLALLEAARAAAEREVSELRAALRGLERARLESRRELQELRRQVRDSGDSGDSGVAQSLPGHRGCSR